MPIFNYISSASGLLPVIAAVINFKNLDYTLKLITAFFLISFINEFFQWLYFMGNIDMQNNQPLFYLSDVISLIFFCWIYFRSFYNINLKYFTLLAGGACLITILFFAVKNSIWSYPTWANTALAVLMIIISLLYFNQLFNRQEFLQIEKQPMFWFNSGVLIYFSFNIFLFMLFNELGILSNLYISHLITNTITNIIFTIGLSCQPQKIN